jgi:hypothetical protein
VTTLRFELTDALLGKAARERCIAFARMHFRARELLIAGASGVVFAVAILRHGHWLWWIAAIPPAVFAILIAGWLATLWWLPRHVVARQRRLPHRRVELELNDANFAFVTAQARLELAWAELEDVQRLPSFWLFCTRGGARIPVPADALLPEHLSFVRSRLGAGAAAIKRP